MEMASSILRGILSAYRAISTDVTPPDWDTYPPEPLRSRIHHGNIARSFRDRAFASRSRC